MRLMWYRIQIILLLLVFALLVQNTCPHGFAGKSTVAATCSHCPWKQMHNPPTETEQLSFASHPTAHLPIYVLDMPNTQPAFRLSAIASPQPVIPNTYKNATPDELLHPPRA